jgi:hypothetical protein
MHVFGPETHMTAICSMALGLKPIPVSTAAYVFVVVVGSWLDESRTGGVSRCALRLTLDQ